MIRFLLGSVLIFAMLSSCQKNDPTPTCPDLLVSDIMPLKGVSNSVITIKGKNYGSNQSVVIVKFNSLQGTIISFSDTLIKVAVPENATTGKISITANTCSIVSTQDFVVLKGKWTRKADVPKDLPTDIGRFRGHGFSIGTKGYYFGGASHYITSGNFVTFTPRKDLYEYDPLIDQWTRKADCGTEFMGGIALVINDKAYVGLGFSNQFGNTRQIWEYNPVTNQWTRKADLPILPNHLNPQFDKVFATTIGNKGYIGLYDPSSILPGELWEFDPLINSWTFRTTLPTNFSAPSWYLPISFSINNKIYAGNLSPTTEVLEYDVISNIWALRTDYPGSSLFRPGTFKINNKVYLAGGSKECWEYDMTTNSWKEYSFYGHTTQGTAFSIGNKGYHLTGYNIPSSGVGITQDELWEFDPTK